MRQNLTIPETAVWVLLYPLIFVGLKQAWQRHRQGALFLILLSTLISCFYAIYSGNVGVAYRMRIQVWILWAPFIGWGWVVVRHPRRRSA
ncbi:hypothetical protein AYO40_05800 [Planctomycetaceae bacterium SCGC AG-212-D15]|nr:hypothetical protein AYO40_05800 [Planctomycetaceae bacterium SCGC AG-212-D15]